MDQVCAAQEVGGVPSIDTARALLPRQRRTCTGGGPAAMLRNGTSGTLEPGFMSMQRC